MSSFTVSLTGSSSTLRTTLFPSLLLQKERSWEAALLDFTTYNSIPNITENVNNKLHFYKEKEDTKPHVVIELNTGSYEIEDINRELKEKVGADNIELKANNNLLKCEIFSKYFIDFSKDHSIGSVLGFPSSTGLLDANTLHMGKEVVNIIKVNTINITCNIIQGSYKNGFNQHILHTFYPTVAPGFKIVEKPHNLVYLPLTTSYISDIEVNVLDQDENLIDFRGETVSLRIHIKSTT